MKLYRVKFCGLEIWGLGLGLQNYVLPQPKLAVVSTVAEADGTTAEASGHIIKSWPKPTIPQPKQAVIFTVAETDGTAAEASGYFYIINIPWPKPTVPQPKLAVKVKTMAETMVPPPEQW